MTKKIKVTVVRRDQIDVEKLASALVEIAVRVVKKPSKPVLNEEISAHE